MDVLIPTWTAEAREFWERVFCASIPALQQEGNITPAHVLADAKSYADVAVILWRETFEKPTK
jgi:hypothetical protein